MEIAKEVKEIVSKYAKARVFVFGSVVKGDYSVGLSDIDIAIVSEEFENKEKKLKVYDILFSKYFATPLEFHFFTEKQWKRFLKFIGNDYIRV